MYHYSHVRHASFYIQFTVIDYYVFNEQRVLKYAEFKFRALAVELKALVKQTSMYQSELAHLQQREEQLAKERRWHWMSVCKWSDEICIIMTGEF